MKIGFDAKRAFLNQSGLGNYARNLLSSLCVSYPVDQYTLFTTRRPDNDFSRFIASQNTVSVEEPRSFVDKKLRARWRSYGITDELNKLGLDLYHGLSNELPFNIHKFKGKKIVTIHDLIFLRHPRLYPFLDRKIYNKKFRSACDIADVIVAVSEQTKRDIGELYFIPESKIRVVYQCCNDVFYKVPSNGQEVRTKYKLPENYLLYVGTIEERKNLLTLVEALKDVKDLPLVVIGKKRAYYKKVAEFIAANKMEKRVIFIEDVDNTQLPAIYRGASLFVYPSLIEGFGIPILEALACGTPVVTTKGSCFPEAGGKGAVYIDPQNAPRMAEEINKLLGSTTLREELSKKGLEHAAAFRPEATAAVLMKLYKEP